MRRIVAARVLEAAWRHPRRFIVEYTLDAPETPADKVTWLESAVFESESIAKDAARALVKGPRIVSTYAAEA